MASGARRRRAFLVAPVALLALLVLVSGCTPGEPEATPTTPLVESDTPSSTPEPEPEPTRPALSELVLTPAGLNTLTIGDVVAEDPVVGMAVVVPDFCGFGEPSPEGDRWAAHPDYDGVATVYGGSRAFGLGVDLATTQLRRVDVFTVGIPTDTGIRLQSNRADVTAAHPGVTPSALPFTDVYEVIGATGKVQIEVATDAREPGYWPATEVDTVIALRAVTLDTGAFSVAASGNVPPFCS